MKYKIILALSLAVLSAHAQTPTNFDYYYDMCFDTNQHYNEHVRFTNNFEYGYNDKCYNVDQVAVDPTQIYTSEESPAQASLAMLENYPAGSKLHQVANRVRGFQDGTRGTLQTTGKLHAARLHTGLEWNMKFITLPGDFSLSAEVSFSDIGLKDITWKDQTKDQTVQDYLVKRDITSDLASFVKTHSKDLDIQAHKYTSMDDSVIMLNWGHTFIQNRNRLKSVRLNLRAGALLPFGREKSEDRVFDLSFSHDKTWGVPCGAGLLLDLSGGFRVGLDIGLLMRAGKTKNWRLKTHRSQTEYLLLTKGKATKEYGFLWKFNLYSQLTELAPGLTLTGGYQLYKHNESSFYPQDYIYNAAILDTAQTKEESISHNFVLDIFYDGGKALENKYIRPQVSLRMKFPFGGTRMASMYTIGGQLSLLF